MKRLSVLLLALALLLPLALSVNADKYNKKIGNVKNFTGTIATDGVKDEAYEKYGLKLSADQWEGFGIDQGTGGVFWFLFTDHYSILHIFTEVKDNTPIMPSAEKQSWMAGCCHTDCCEIWIDPTNEAGSSLSQAIRAEGWHYRCDISGYTSGTLWGSEYLGNDQCDPFFKCNVQMTTDGYVIEWEIFTDAYERQNNRGDGWGLQIMMKDVYDPRHDGENWGYENYYMCDYTYASSLNGAYLSMEYLDYIVLGNDISPLEPPQPEDPKNPSDGEDDPESPENPEEPGKEDDAGGEQQTPKTADGMVIAVTALLVSAGAAVVVLKKRRG